MDQLHYPVLLEETLSYLNIDKNGVYVDGTLGMGGHSERILSRLEGGRLICIDKDSFAIEQCRARFAPYGDKAVLVHDDFGNVCDILDRLNIDRVTGNAAFHTCTMLLSTCAWTGSAPSPHTR